MRTTKTKKNRAFLGTNALIGSGLRLTQQRRALAELLFDGTHKHMTAEQVYASMQKKRANVSLATVYNTLHQFTAAGLLREIGIDATRVYFDTNTQTHHHFYDDQTGHLIDIPEKAVGISHLPKSPKGTRFERVDVIVRVRSRA